MKSTHRDDAGPNRPGDLSEADRILLLALRAWGGQSRVPGSAKGLPPAPGRFYRDSGIDSSRPGAVTFATPGIAVWYRQPRRPRPGLRTRGARPRPQGHGARRSGSGPSELVGSCAAGGIPGGSEGRRRRGTRAAAQRRADRAAPRQRRPANRPDARSRGSGLGHVPLERAVGGGRSGPGRRPAGHRRAQPPLTPSRIPPLPLRWDRQARPRRPGGDRSRHDTGGSRTRRVVPGPPGICRSGVRGRCAARCPIPPGREGCPTAVAQRGSGS